MRAKTVKDIIEWDVSSWKHALSFWEKHTADLDGASVLEIGSRGGGLSLYFALRGCTVVCSDIDNPAEKALNLHKKYRVTPHISYMNIDAADMGFPDNEFDVVSFKSVLGGIGRDNNYALQKKAVKEMHRVLKPGGRLLFAENMKASSLHVFFRRRYVRWGKSWRYIAADETAELFSPFSNLKTQYYGFFAAFGRTEFQRALLHILDVPLHSFIRERDRYIVFGCATK